MMNSTSIFGLLIILLIVNYLAALPFSVIHDGSVNYSQRNDSKNYETLTHSKSIRKEKLFKNKSDNGLPVIKGYYFKIDPYGDVDTVIANYTIDDNGFRAFVNKLKPELPEDAVESRIISGPCDY